MSLFNMADLIPLGAVYLLIKTTYTHFAFRYKQNVGTPICYISGLKCLMTLLPCCLRLVHTVSSAHPRSLLVVWLILSRRNFYPLNIVSFAGYTLIYSYKLICSTLPIFSIVLAFCESVNLVIHTSFLLFSELILWINSVLALKKSISTLYNCSLDIFGLISS